MLYINSNDKEKKHIETYLLSKLSSSIEQNYDLSKKHLFKKKSGNAKYYYQMKYDETIENDLQIFHQIYKENIPFRVYGMHTNLYITENGYDGIFVDIDLKNSQIIFDEDQKVFKVTSNTTVNSLILFAEKVGYDFSALTGIPGMVGSGVVGNAGWSPSGKSFSNFINRITVYDFEEGKYIDIEPQNDFFEIRGSFIKRENSNKYKYFVKDIFLKTDFIGTDEVQKKRFAQIEKRKESLKYGFLEGTAGSVWSNIHLKNKLGKAFPRILQENPSINKNFNGARYSDYGNWYFTTDENTRDKDVAYLFRHTINSVKELYSTNLHKEMIILDKQGEIDVEEFIENNLK